MTRTVKGRKSRIATVALAGGLFGAALCLLLLAFVLRAGGLQTAANVAQLMSIPLGLLSPLVLLLLWWRRVRQPTPVTSTDVAQLREHLVPLVLERWRTEARIRALDDPDPIPVQWRVTDDHRLIDVPGNLTSGALTVASSADITTLVGEFRRLRRRRLVILGGPGAGKTTLAMQILLGLLREREGNDAEAVPVLLSAASWNPWRYEDLWEWVADRIEQDYPELAAANYGVQTLQVFAKQGHVLPVVDGLDETTPQVRPTLLAALHGAMDAQTQMILTSRGDEYLATVEAYGRVMPSAVVIEPEPLSAGAAADYIERCLPAEPGLGWRAVLKRLRNAGNSYGSAHALAEVASAPLGLWLLRVTYVTPRTDPAPLIDEEYIAGADALRSHLFDRLIEATITARPPSDSLADLFRPKRQYETADAERWLHFLAVNLNRHDTRDFNWTRDVPALARAVRPGRITHLIEGAASVTKTYVDELLSRSPRRALPLIVPPLAVAILLILLLGKVTTALSGLVLGSVASIVLGVISGAGAVAGLLAVAFRLYEAAEFPDRYGPADLANDLIERWQGAKRFLRAAVPTVAYGLIYATLTGVCAGVPLALLAPHVNVGQASVVIGAMFGILAGFRYQMDLMIPPGGGTRTLWYGLRPWTGLRSGVLLGLPVGLLGGTASTFIYDQQSAFLPLVVLTTSVACTLIVLLRALLIPVFCSITSLCVAVLRRPQRHTHNEGSLGLWRAAEAGQKTRFVYAAILTVFLSTAAAIGCRILWSTPAWIALRQHGPADWLAARVHDFSFVWTGQLRYIVALMLAWIVTRLLPPRRRTWWRWVPFLAIAAIVIKLWPRWAPPDAFRLVLTGHFQALEVDFRLQASANVASRWGPGTVRSTLNLADLINPGPLRQALLFWLALLGLGIAGTLLARVEAAKPKTWWINRLTSLPHVLAGRLPANLIDFLDDAHRLGLLRTVGTTVYQFRHAEFQDHLARDDGDREWRA
ncbi:NACHT domain-containing protein [Actinoplanes sp. Pm04-4]|uniref:NACHT domain-containing protein n=1 Tax=Paractinoplanes pyxinae TaxID=2997416 RepID=A0ABT4BFF4_9ACTN|nr:NACHT domain-containing protein [Actinoplanes pyxinae]MCY1144687.1 NACHT domain-containing protein [Actinoplanes pyxinae]